MTDIHRRLIWNCTISDAIICHLTIIILLPLIILYPKEKIIEMIFVLRKCLQNHEFKLKDLPTGIIQIKQHSKNFWHYFEELEVYRMKTTLKRNLSRKCEETEFIITEANRHCFSNNVSYLRKTYLLPYKIQLHQELNTNNYEKRVRSVLEHWIITTSTILLLPIHINVQLSTINTLGEWMYGSNIVE